MISGIFGMFSQYDCIIIYVIVHNEEVSEKNKSSPNIYQYPSDDEFLSAIDDFLTNRMKHSPIESKICKTYGSGT